MNAVKIVYVEMLSPLYTKMQYGNYSIITCIILMGMSVQIPKSICALCSDTITGASHKEY